MRLDHAALRVLDRAATVDFFCKAFGYRIGEHFTIYLNEEKTDVAYSTSLLPSETEGVPPKKLRWVHPRMYWSGKSYQQYDFHLPPEIFVSEGPVGSTVYNWAKAREGIGNYLHHLAWQTDDVEKTQREWIKNGWLGFTTDEVLSCDDLQQIFSRPCPFTGITYEFIKRKGRGFCVENVARLMKSTNNDNIINTNPVSLINSVGLAQPPYEGESPPPIPTDTEPDGPNPVCQTGGEAAPGPGGEEEDAAIYKEVLQRITQESPIQNPV